MTLKRAKRTGGAFLNLKELVAESGGQVLAVFRIVEFQESEKATGFHGVNLPVVADVFIASGPRAGEVHLGERFIGAITSALRGVRNPNITKGEKAEEPTNEIGDEIVCRLKVLNPGQPNAGVVGDEPSDAECDAVEELYSDDVWETATEVEEKPKAAASGKKRPW